MILTSHFRLASLACLAALATACAGNGDDDDATASISQEDQATLDVKTYINAELVKLTDAAQKLQDAAPDADADGWNIDDDAADVKHMREVWATTRDAYEHIEGAIAVLFMDLDVSTDQRYDAFIEKNGPDDNLFDDEGVTGMHAIERILWADSHPDRVVAFESKLDGYQAAAFPATKDEADDFKNKLAERLVTDTLKMRSDFKQQALDSSTAYRGVIGSLREQVEKVTLAATAEDESRYAQRTLDDMRANLDGGRKVYAAFRNWVKKDAGADKDAKIEAGFQAIADAYAESDGPAIPTVPDGFNPDKPTAADLKTPYGKLWTLLNTQTDLEAKDSLVSVMLESADAMNIPQLPE